MLRVDVQKFWRDYVQKMLLRDDVQKMERLCSKDVERLCSKDVDR